MGLLAKLLVHTLVLSWPVSTVPVVGERRGLYRPVLEDGVCLQEGARQRVLIANRNVYI